MNLPHVPGIITAEQAACTATSIAALQRPSGMIEWFPEGHTDPWNHIEAAMALATCGRLREATAAFDWLQSTQRPDGGWFNYYVGDCVEDTKTDSNCVAYVATGVWHLWLVTGDLQLVEQYWPMVERAVDAVLTYQTPRGEVVWAQRPDGSRWDYALLTGSCSIYHSLGCAVRLGHVAGQPRTDWHQAQARLGDVIRDQPNAFAPKDRWAMDWYYPVLAGAVTGDDAVKRLLDRWEEFVLEGHGVRCVNDEPWVTAAETSECALAHLICGEHEKARALLSWAQSLRADDGSYFTGVVLPEGVHYPDQERSAYTAAAVILAADALAGTNPTSSLFTEPAVAEVSTGV